MEQPVYQVRLATLADVDRLPAIEQAASVLYATRPDLAWLVDAPPLPVSTFRHAAKAGRLWVAADDKGYAVGFALVDEPRVTDGDLHLRELDVDPAHGRRGLGRRLVEAVLDQARQRCCCVTLTTFRDLPWNAPFYRRLGFREVPAAALTPALRAILAAEEEAGFDLAERLAMRWQW